MATMTRPGIAAAPERTYAPRKNPGAVIWDWMTTVDHKKIGVMYTFLGVIYFIVGGIEAATRHTLIHAGENRLVNAILTGADAEDLLPLLTTKGQPVLMPAVDLLTQLWRPRMPWLPDEEIRLLAETGMRLTVSHLLTPTGPVEDAVATITALMRRLIPEAPDE